MADVATLDLPVPTLEGAGALYCTGEESLRLTVFDAAAGVTVALAGRFLPIKTRETDDAARVGTFKRTLIPTTNRVASVATEALGKGWLIDGAVVASGGSPSDGQCYAVVELVRGQTGATEVTTLLACGYVTAKQRLPLVGAKFQGFLEGGGALRSISGTQPGAGAEISETCPTGARWTLLAFEADLVTAVAAANRVPQLTIDDGAAVFARVSVNQNETASQTWRNSFQTGVPQLFDGTRFIVTTPLGCDLQIPAGGRIRTVTANIQAADQYAVPQYLVREWIEGA
jgi:hypothetical protein